MKPFAPLGAVFTLQCLVALRRCVDILERVFAKGIGLLTEAEGLRHDMGDDALVKEISSVMAVAGHELNTSISTVKASKMATRMSDSKVLFSIKHEYQTYAESGHEGHANIPHRPPFR